MSRKNSLTPSRVASAIRESKILGERAAMVTNSSFETTTRVDSSA
jgi:hypothetical protein